LIVVGLLHCTVAVHLFGKFLSCPRWEVWRHDAGGMPTRIQVKRVISEVQREMLDIRRGLLL
jgi:hypothetical protein